MPGVYAHVEAMRSQGEVKMFADEISSCRRQAMQTTPACNQYGEQAQHACDASTAHCDDRMMPRWGQGLDASVSHRDEIAQRAENAPWVALAVFVCVSALFYGVRWALTGHLRPLWLIKRREG